MSTKKNVSTQLIANEVGMQKKFTVREFTLEELLEMKTATSVQQTPINQKNIAVLREDFRIREMINPFSVAYFDSNYYLGGGRHRAFTHKELGRPLDTVFSCILYEVDSAAELNEIIIQLNGGRRTSGTEKKLLRLGGELGKEIGTEELTEVYESYLSIKDTKTLIATLKTDLVARLLNCDTTGIITETMMMQLVNAVWANVFGLAKYKNFLYLLTYDIKNVNGFLHGAVEELTTSFQATITTNPHITRWARDGKALLIDKASKQLLTALPAMFTVAPKSTTSKVKSGSLAIVAPVATTVAEKRKEAEAVTTVVVEPEVVAV
jgi:hypothetical protein